MKYPFGRGLGTLLLSCFLGGVWSATIVSSLGLCALVLRMGYAGWHISGGIVLLGSLYVVKKVLTRNLLHTEGEACRCKIDTRIGITGFAASYLFVWAVLEISVLAWG